MNREEPPVILLHGFAAPPCATYFFGKLLQHRGFEVVRWDYPSFRVPIPGLAERLVNFIQSRWESNQKLHFVAHSMGSAVVRAALPSLHSDQIGRFVFLAPPIRGTPLANVAPRFLQKLFPPIRELKASSDSYVRNLLLPPSEAFAVIAGVFDLNVPLPFTKVDVVRHHRTICATHNSILISPRAAELVERFLKTGTLVEQ
jgi:pimeloyl-ACP methyl ester carboxylesterase